MIKFETIKKLEKLGLSQYEYEEIVKKLNRKPNELELYLFSAMWSEHCGYKHSKKYLDMLPRTKSLFSSENAGGIKIGNHVIFFKTESHNHPSAVEPYQGAATGIGGILRDILAMNARPIALLNSLKFGPIERMKLPDDINNAVSIINNDTHCDMESFSRNKYLLNGVAEGISDYGNSTGVPTIGGEVSFNECYNLSPLVNVMAAGICHKNNVKTAAAKENLYVTLIGSATGRDGLFGAAFASKELEGDSSDRLSVQIGDAYTKKKLIEATLEILQSKNVFCSQDLGAAGLLSSTSEMAAKGDVSMDLYLDKVPLREENMQPYEVMLSESQERMVFGANKAGVDEIVKICKKYELNAAIIGKTGKGNTYNLYHNDILLASVPVKALCKPVLYDLNPKKPEYIDVLKKKKLFLDTKINTPQNIKYLIFKITAAPAFASKKYIYSQYDSTVCARTLKNPHFIGVSPLYIREEDTTIGFSMDSNEDLCLLNPYTGAFNIIFESYRNAVSSGFEPLGITNCLNFANPEKPDVAYQFTETIKGIKDALCTLNLPVVSGNVSFYNEGVKKTDIHTDDVKIKINPTPVIGMLSILKTKNPIYTRSLSDETIFVIGKQINKHSCTGASLYQRLFFNFLGGKPDIIDFELEMKLKSAIFDLNIKGEISGAIDVSKGGIIGALLIMLFNSFNFNDNKNSEQLGFSCCLPCDIDILFGEITGRYLISAKNADKVEQYLIGSQIPYEKLGKTNNTGNLNLGFVKINLAELREIYENSLERKA